MQPRPYWERKHKTCRRYDEPGEAHALTFSCFQHRPFLSKDRTCRWLVDSLDAARRRLNFHVWAYVIMPEHVHLLLFPTDPAYSISKILSAVKIPVSRSAVAYVRRDNPTGLAAMRDLQPSGKTSYRFWQRGGGYDRNLVNPKYVHAAIDYIHANPVRRELAKVSEDWFWSSAGYYAGTSRVPLIPDTGLIPNLDDASRVLRSR